MFLEIPDFSLSNLQMLTMDQIFTFFNIFYGKYHGITPAKLWYMKLSIFYFFNLKGRPVWVWLHYTCINEVIDVVAVNMSKAEVNMCMGDL